MSKRAHKIGLFAFLLFMLFFFNVGYVQSLKDASIQGAFETKRKISQNTFDVAVWVFLAERYEFIDTNIRDEVVVDITISSTEPPTTPYVISASIQFFLTEVTDLPPRANYTYGFWGFPPIGTLKIYLPANTTYSFIKLRGYLSSSSVFWRKTAEVDFLNVTSSSVAYAPSYTLILVPPSTSRVLKVYSYAYPDLHYEEASIAEQRCIVVTDSHPESPMIILYEPEAWEAYALILMVMTLFMSYAMPYAFTKYKISSTSPQSIIMFLKLVSSNIIISLRRLHTKISKLDSSKLLTVYILCALLMISLSFAVGPDPRLKVYVLASTSETAGTISEFVYREVGAVAITVFDEMNEFKILTDFGVFSAVIIGDFFPPSEHTVRSYIYPGLDSVPWIIILERYAVSTFSLEIQSRYAKKTIIVEDLVALGHALHRIPRRINALGLNVSPALYLAVSAFIGVCSFIIVFFGIGFLVSRLIEVGKKPEASGFPEAIAYSTFVFFFTQTVYIVCNVFLAMPLGLHATYAVFAPVTAVNLLGFGGGTRPRMFSGLAGFLFGSLVSLKEGLKLDRTVFASFVVMSLFILIDPLTNGIIFYEFILFLTVGPGFEYTSMTRSYVRTFLGTMASAFGAWVSPAYPVSTGTMLYFAGAILLCLFAKLKKGTATALLLICAFCVSMGGIRVADMIPLKIATSFVPGIITGFFFATIFYLISLAEKVIRKKIGAVTRLT